MAMNNSLAEVRPELVSEWSEKNLPLTPDNITFGSNKKVWWKGTCGHEWQTSVTDDDIARYSVMHGNEQLFASKYKLYLPTKEELKAEIETQKAMFYLQQQENEEKETE